MGKRLALSEQGLRNREAWELESAEEKLSGILSDSAIFGANLATVGLSGQVCQYFTELISGAGAVRATLKKYVWEKR